MAILERRFKMSEAYIEYLLETCDDEALVNQMIDQFLLEEGQK